MNQRMKILRTSIKQKEKCLLGEVFNLNNSKNMCECEEQEYYNFDNLETDFYYCLNCGGYMSYLPSI